MKVSSELAGSNVQRIDRCRRRESCSLTMSRPTGHRLPSHSLVLPLPAGSVTTETFSTRQTPERQLLLRIHATLQTLWSNFFIGEVPPLLFVLSAVCYPTVVHDDWS